jgi:AcrR family transcriptional regulator
MASAQEIPLRERKKLRTRQTISDAATALFAERGFEAVTVDDVAAAAEVSKKTVFNYFGCKEDLLFDEAEAAKARLVAAVRDRDDGESVLDGARRNALAAIERMCSGEDPWIEKMARLVAASPSLQAREAEIFDTIAHGLAEMVREEMGADEGDCRPYITAQAIMAVQRSVVQSARVRVLRGQTGKSLTNALRREAQRGFALLEEGLGDCGKAV